MALKEYQHIESDHQESIQLVRSTSILGRKRIAVLHRMEKDSNPSSPFGTPSQKRRVRSVRLGGPNRLESLPQDLLVRILCKVTHGDLKQLLLVSKFVNEAALIAKEIHFAYSTPQTKRVFRNIDDLGCEDHLEAPNAPMQRRVVRSRIDFDKLDGIGVALFTDDLVVEM